MNCSQPLNSLAFDLVASIRGEIRERGPISFARFMEHALYHPVHGYYSSGRCAIGRHGDLTRERVDAHVHGLHELLVEDFTGVDRFEQFGGHGVSFQ